MNRNICPLIGVLCLTLVGCCVRGPFVFVVPPHTAEEQISECETAHPDAEVKHLSHEEWSKMKEAWLED